ncbi:MAG: uroporphyrinogen-III synthase [Candidatus Hydrothermarchaeota archaeon]
MRIAITRPREQSSETKVKLESLGMKPVCFPLIEIVPDLKNIQSFKEDLKNRSIDIIVFTSINGARVVLEEMNEEEIRRLRNIEIFSIGPKTRDFLLNYKIFSKIPEEYTSKALADMLDVRGKDIYLLRTSSGSRLLYNTLIRKGANVHDVHVYHSRMPHIDRIKPLIGEIINKNLDAILFTSSLAVEHLFKSARELGVLEEVLAGLRDMKVVVIGPVTARILSDFGISPLIPEEYTVDAMIDVIMDKT